MEALIETLVDEIQSVEESLKTRFPAGLPSDLDNDVALRSISDTLWTACIHDAMAAPTWFHLFFYGVLSGDQHKRLKKSGTEDPIDLLIGDSSTGGHPLCASDLINKIARDPGNAKLASQLRQKELFCDMMLHILVNKQSGGKVKTEWVMLISSILKDGRLVARAFQTSTRLRLTSSQSVSDTIKAEALGVG